MVLTAHLGLVAAALLLSSFGGACQYNGLPVQRVDRAFAQTVADDFSRDGVLARALGVTELAGTRILAYPMAGYVYCALFFVPRSLAPWKGYPTAQCFTGYVVGMAADTTDQLRGFEANIEEILLNGGFLLFIPMMLVYGFAMGLFDRLCAGSPRSLVPTGAGGGLRYVAGVCLH